MALGLQGLLVALLWLFMPDYPANDPGEMSYFAMLWSIIRLVTRYPVLACGCLMVIFSNAVFASYWTTFTALLSSPLYNYSSLEIGLFALIGIAPWALTPPYSSVVIDRFVPNLSVGLGLVYALIVVLVGTYTGTLPIAGIVIQTIAIDFGHRLPVCNLYNYLHARNRTNAAYTVSAFAGQLTGTSVGNHLYAVGGLDPSWSGQHRVPRRSL
ncbi:hypothetical protein Daesc_008207 [Daldinia eschscholtzii]|uniref:Uncharacterized protein n=1 Tax=Daldinia eschscholtzii TaxID=292717 RepID=A0AAX6MBQ2_9PEZI